MRAFAWALFVLVLMSSTVSAAPSVRASPVPAAASGAPAPDLRIGFLQAVDSLNPLMGINEPSFVLYGLLYDEPFAFDPDGNILPNLVTSASCADPSCSIWNYTVRQGVTWSDGTEFTAADVNFTWNYLSQNLIQLWAYEPYFNHVVVCTSTNRPACGAVLSASNPWNVTLYFDEPFAAARDLLAPILQQRQWGAIAPRTAQTNYANQEPIGTGPFIADPDLYQELVNSLTTLTPLHLIRNPTYHAVGATTPSTAIANLYLYSYGDANTMASALEAGQLDLGEFTTSTIGPVRGQPNILVQSVLQVIRTWNDVGISQCDTLAADARLNPARFDVNVRQALARATNKDHIVQDIYDGQGARGDSLLSPIAPAWWYDPVAGGDNLTFDVATANAILNQSGYTTWSGGSFGHGVREATNPITVSIQSSANAFRVENITNVTKTIPAGTLLSFTLAVRPPSAFPEEIVTADYLQAQWAQIGVQVTIKQETTEAALSLDVYGCYVELYIWYWSSDPDPNYMLSMESSWTLDGWNDNYWVNTSYNRLYLAQLGAQSLSLREADAQAAEKLQYDLASYLIYLYPYGEWAMRTDLWQGWGDWGAHPYLQLNAPWGANPLWFALTCPSCSPVSPPPAPTPPSLTPAGNVSVFQGTNLVLTSVSSDADPSVQLNFTSDWGDGTATTVVTGSANPSATTQHAWAVLGAYRVNGIVYDGYNAPVWSANAVTVNVVASSNPGTLVGIVNDSLGGPMPGAFVVATPGNWATSSTGSGAYSISLPAGTYSVTATAPYAAPVTKTNVTVALGGTTTVDFVLTSTAGWIAGAVIDAASGGPIAGAAVLATSGGGTQRAVATNAQGAFNLTVVPGTYTVNLSAPGYVSASAVGVAVSPGHATSVDRALVPTVNPIHLTLASALGRPGHAIVLSGSVAAPGNGTWTLDFGDGTNATGTQGVGTTPVTASHVYAAQGTYTLRLVVTSYLMSADRTATVLVDGTPPSLRITAPTGAATFTAASVTVTWTGQDNLSGIGHYEVSVDGGAHLNLGTNTSFTQNFADGSHMVTVWAFDLAGNNASESVSFRVDTNPFSPSGPYAGAPTYAIIAVAVVGVAFVMWRRQRRAKPPRETPPTPPANP